MKIAGQFANVASSPAQYFAVKNPDGLPLLSAPAAGTFNLQTEVRGAIY